MIVLDRLVDLVLASADDLPGFLTAVADGSGVLGRPVVADADLAAVVRAVPAGLQVPVTVVTSGGAGGLVGLTRRTLPGVDVAAVVSTLRDLEDLAGNAARVVAAASALPEQVQVYVEMPSAPGWQRAVEVVEAAGLLARVAWHDGGPETVEQLSVLVEADLAFSVSGVAPGQLLLLLRTVEALVEGDDPSRLAEADPAEHARVVAGWDELTQRRVRRRLVSCDTPEALRVVRELTDLELIPAD